MEFKLTQFAAKFGRGMKRRSSGRIVALSAILTVIIGAGLIVCLPGGQAQSGQTQPDYSQVDDFLYGKRTLLRNDDLVMTFDYFLGGAGEARQVLFTGGTNNSTANVLTYDQKTIPVGTAGCTLTEGCNLDYHYYDSLEPAIGRFFNTVRDTTVIYPLQLDTALSPLLVSMAGKTVGDSSPAAGLTWTTAQEVDFVSGATSFFSAVADFNGDGFDDLVMAWAIRVGPLSNTYLRIATAVDVNDPGKGFTFGPQVVIPNNSGGVNTIRDVEVGDFNGDFQPEIVTLVNALTLDLSTLSVNPETLVISPGGTVSLGKAQGTLPGQVAAGQFTGASHSQLVVADQLVDGGNIEVHFIDFDTNSIQPVRKTTWVTPDLGTSVTLRLKAGRFKSGSPTEQVAWMSSSVGGTRLSVLTVDPRTLNVSRKADILPINDPGSTFGGFDIAVGNFDNMQQSLADPTQLERDPDLQIAVLGFRVIGSPTRANTAALFLYDVSDDYSSLTQASEVVLRANYFGFNNIKAMSIAAGDLQGRSFRLGPGYKVTVDRTEPTVVLAMPPMHADYISPSGNDSPTVLNLSVAPDGFMSGYSQTTTTDTTVTQTDTTSSSFSGKESIGGSVSAGTFSPGGDLENGVKVSDTFTAKQDLKNSTDTINGAFNGTDYAISQTTGLSDVLWFKDTSYFLWVYPVIGRNVCPGDKPNCQDSDKLPMQLMFSAPLPTTIHRLATDTIEWYQPPWEFGNILSYPAGLAQLKQYIPSIQLLTADTTVFATDDASAQLKTTWSNGKTTGTNVESEKLFSEENDLSVEGVTDVAPFGFGGEGTAKLNLNFGGSTGTKSLNESNTKFSSAQGLTISKSASFTNAFLYKYLFSPFIFGQVKPVGYTDPVNSDADLLAYGSLRSAYTVDPLSNSTGAWWSQSPYQSLPDLAVSHPNRWSYGAKSKPSNGIIPTNCIGLGNTTQMDCITPTEREPENPWLDAFHDMRGLFITNKNNPNPPKPNPFVAGSGGAQMETINEKGQVTLTTRVYNYSFKAMPTTTKVKARFYGMLLNEQNLPIGTDGKVDVTGPSFFIGETTLGPIPPFNNDLSAPLNWVLASTNFDTTGRANQSVGFWVVVWMEDGNGNLVQELASHGLTGKPPSVPSGAISSFAAITKFEEMVNNPLKQQATDPDQISFSNNIGFYRSAFHILPETSTSTLRTASAVSLPTVKVERVDVSGTRLNPGGSVEGSVLLRNGAEELLGVTVYFYNGDPAAGGQLVDLERLGRLRANSQQKVSIRFRPKTCGSHRLFVRVAPGRQYAVEGKATEQVRVDCSEPACFTRACMKSPQYYRNNLIQLPQGKVTIAGRGFVSDVKTNNTAAMAKALKGGNGALVNFNQQYVTLQLSLLGTNDPNNDAERGNLLCYNARFPAVRLSTGAMLRPEMTIEDLFKEAKQAAKRGDAIDLRTIAHVMRFINGEDPNGACRQ